jgi:NitT/TauT family transport system substrate-binding protein
MTDEAIAYAIEAMKSNGIVFSGEALTMGAGAMTDAKVEDFFNKMAAVGAVPADLDWKASYTLQFVNQGVGLDLKPAE